MSIQNLSAVDRNLAFQILTKAAVQGIDVHFKLQDRAQVYKTRLKKNPVRKNFITDLKNSEFHPEEEVTFKIIIDQRLFFLKTVLKPSAQFYYFEDFSAMFELVRRKKQRFLIPEVWSQNARIQAINAPLELKSAAIILDLSRAGIRLRIKADLPQYHKKQTVNLYFKVYRRAEILVKSKIVHVKPLQGGGYVMGLEFADNSILIANKIQNVCDDLAFYYAARE